MTEVAAAERQPVQPQDIINDEFRRVWNANGFDGIAEAVEQKAHDWNENTPGTAHVVRLTDVTLRDGQQQRTDEVSAEQRIEVFDELIKTGVDRIEIGHLGNANGDQQFADRLVGHIAAKERDGEEGQRYKDTKIQVLFGSQEDIIKQGIGVLETAFQREYGEGWREIMANKVVVHVYDRIHDALRNTSSTPYTDGRSAERVAMAAQHAVDAGFRHFSVSAEAATATGPANAVQFYRSVNEFLFEAGAQSVNVNLANTYGFSAHHAWNHATLAAFNHAVKHGNPGRVTTSIHAHNDMNSGLDFALMSVAAGFDRVETTHIGMGERVGNAAGVDVLARLFEQARHAAHPESMTMSDPLVQRIGGAAVRHLVRIDRDLVTGAQHAHAAGETIAKIFGCHARYRWQRTIPGNPYAFDNGSGPHDQAMWTSVIDGDRPFYGNYGWAITVANMLGNELAGRIAIGDPKAVQQVTVAGFTGGGKSALIAEGRFPEVSAREHARRQEKFAEYRDRIARAAVDGFMLHIA